MPAPAARGPNPPPNRDVNKGKRVNRPKINKHPTTELYGKKPTTTKSTVPSNRPKLPARGTRDVDFRREPGAKRGRMYVDGRVVGSGKRENLPWQPVPRTKRKP